MKDFRKLNVWQKAHLLTIAVYQESKAFPKDEIFGITSQVRRSSSSIPANIAEGCGRVGDVEFGRFLQIAFGSASELEYYLLLANELKFLNEKQYKNLNTQVCDVKKILTTLIQKLKSRPQNAVS